MTLEELAAMIEADKVDRMYREKSFDAWFGRVIAANIKYDDNPARFNSLRTVARAAFIAGATEGHNQGNGK